MSNIIGVVDGFENSYIKGWVYNTEYITKRHKVILKIDDKIVASSKAEFFREDLLQAGYGDGYYAFYMPFPEKYCNNIQYNCHLYIDEPFFELSNSPLALQVSVKDCQNILSNVEEIKDHRFYFDITDLLLYLANHNTLTGIQRVQVSVISSLFADVLMLQSCEFLYLEQDKSRFLQIDKEKLRFILKSYHHKNSDHQINSKRLDIYLTGKIYKNFDEVKYSVLCNLGTYWGIPEYLKTIDRFKQEGLKFVPLLHDVIALKSPELCDYATVKVFKTFVYESIKYSDLILSVSEHTKKDITAYAKQVNLDIPEIQVTTNGSFIDLESAKVAKSTNKIVSEPYVLFVGTIEIRKNHRFTLRIWQELFNKYKGDIPRLVCVGKLGWKINSFIEELHQSNFVSGKISIFSNISDTDLISLYKNALFTIYPSLYEGWGLPVGESLAFGKVCMTTKLSSIPEVAGKAAYYIDIDDYESSFADVEHMIFDKRFREEQEKVVKANYNPIQWKNVTKNIIKGLIKAGAVENNDKNIAKLELENEYLFKSYRDIFDFEEEDGLEQLRVLREKTKLYFQEGYGNIDNFLVTNEITQLGEWLDFTSWGRWGSGSGCGLSFSCDKYSDDLYIYIRIKVNKKQKNKIISISSEYEKSKQLVEVKSRTVLKLKLSDYLYRGLVNITFKYYFPNPQDKFEMEKQEKFMSKHAIGFESLIVR